MNVYIIKFWPFFSLKCLLKAIYFPVNMALATFYRVFNVIQLKYTVITIKISPFTHASI